MNSRLKVERTYWHRQGEKPLFPELEWNKPERRNQAGRLLIVGGNVNQLSAPASAYELALKTGVGYAKVLLPGKTKRLIGPTVPDTFFLPSTNSGEFSQDGYEELLGYMQWADMVLLAGDFGRNSQTSVLLERALQHTTVPVVLVLDSIEALQNNAPLLSQRANTHLVISFPQLQRMVKNLNLPKALVSTAELIQVIEFLHEFTQKTACTITTLVSPKILINAVDGEVSSTKIPSSEDYPPHWRLIVATIAACYLIWNPTKPFEALTFSTHELVSSYLQA